MNAGDQKSTLGDSSDENELCSQMRLNLDRLEKLCRSLETVADGLPTNVDISSCHKLARELYPSVKSIHEFEESQLFPYLLKNKVVAANLPGVLERLRFEHWEDQAYGEEVQQALERFAQAPETSNVESLSWMLRGFFEGMRRHVAFERSYVLPLITPHGNTK